VLGHNSATSRWVDVVEMIQAQEIEVRSNSKEDKTETFLKSLDAYKKTTGKGTAGTLKPKHVLQAQ